MATIEARLENAARRVREDLLRPIRLGRATYLVASSSCPGHGYLVHVDAGGTIACTCPAAQWDFPCKHAESVRQLEQQDVALSA